MVIYLYKTILQALKPTGDPDNHQLLEKNMYSPMVWLLVEGVAVCMFSFTATCRVFHTKLQERAAATSNWRSFLVHHFFATKFTQGQQAPPTTVHQPVYRAYDFSLATDGYQAVASLDACATGPINRQTRCQMSDNISLLNYSHALGLLPVAGKPWCRHLIRYSQLVGFAWSRRQRSILLECVLCSPCSNKDAHCGKNEKHVPQGWLRLCHSVTPFLMLGANWLDSE